MKSTLIQKINSSDWWHVSPRDPGAYKKRGKFLASTFLQAEFYGRPNDKSERVNIKNPIFGFSELEILTELFNKKNAQKYLDVVLSDNGEFYQKRINLDAEIYNRAKELEHDAVVLMTQAGKNDLGKGRKPNSIELNLIF